MNWTVIICSPKLFGGLQVQVWPMSAEKIKKIHSHCGCCMRHLATVSPCLYMTVLNQAPALLPRHSPKIRQLVFIVMKSNHCSEWKSYSMSNVLSEFIAFTSCHFLSSWGAGGRLEGKSCQYQILGERTFISPFYIPQLCIVLAGQQVGRQLAWPVLVLFWLHASELSGWHFSPLNTALNYRQMKIEILLQSLIVLFCSILLFVQLPRKEPLPW